MHVKRWQNRHFNTARPRARATLPGSRPRPPAQVRATLPGSRPRRRCPGPLDAGRGSAPGNRPRPKGRPPPRRFAVSGPAYPKTAPGAPRAPALTDPGAPLGRRTRLGGLWRTLRVSDKRIRMGAGKAQLAAPPARPWRPWRPPPASPAHGGPARTAAAAAAFAVREVLLGARPGLPGSQAQAARPSAGHATRERARPGQARVPGSQARAARPSAGHATRERARPSAQGRPAPPPPGGSQATRKPGRRGQAEAARRRRPSYQVGATLPGSRPAPDEPTTTPQFLLLAARGPR